jgi:hypothetical protein
MAKGIPGEEQLIGKAMLLPDNKMITGGINNRVPEAANNKTLSKWKGLFSKWYCRNL